MGLEGPISVLMAVARLNALAEGRTCCKTAISKTLRHGTNFKRQQCIQITSQGIRKVHTGLSLNVQTRVNAKNNKNPIVGSTSQ